MKIFLFLVLFFYGSIAHALSLQDRQFANDAVFTGTIYSDWYDIRNFTFIDFSVLSSVGAGEVQVEYAVNRNGDALIADSVVANFTVGNTVSLFGGGVAKFWVRLRITCTDASCTYKGWFNAKGQML